MDKTEIINSILEACRLHNWINLKSNPIYMSIQVEVELEMLNQAINVLRETIGAAKSDDIPVTIDGEVITFDNLTMEDYDGDRYEHYSYNQKL